METIRELSAIRADIDKIDDQIVQLFVQRMQLAQEVARTKKTTGNAVSHPGREQEILQRVGGAAGALAPYTERLFQTIFTLSKAYQTQLMTESGESK
ncbi:MAG: chorismate mutase [Clostridia bacterium]|nr:chorismate mutase [Clostridia bacterium]